MSFIAVHSNKSEYLVNLNLVEAIKKTIDDRCLMLFATVKDGGQHYFIKTDELYEQVKKMIYQNGG